MPDRVGGRAHWLWLLLLAAGSTLLCCALPMLLVAIGFGAAAAALFANLPFLVDLAVHKAWLFALSGAGLLAAAIAESRRSRQCPADPRLAAACRAANRWNRQILFAATLLWLTGFATAYVALPAHALLAG